MRRQTARTLAALLAAGIALAILAPAAAGTSGAETLKGTIIVSGTSGVRSVINSVVVAKGVFDGQGTIVEVENLPGDPDNVVRDDFVFRGGTMHVISTTVDFSFSVNPKSCRATVTLQQTSEIVGGTGQFAEASGSFTATVDGKGTLARNSDGSCSLELTTLHEEDKIAASGTLTF